mgnify:FL=1
MSLLVAQNSITEQEQSEQVEKTRYSIVPRTDSEYLVTRQRKGLRDFVLTRGQRSVGQDLLDENQLNEDQLEERQKRSSNEELNEDQLDDQELEERLKRSANEDQFH